MKMFHYFIVRIKTLGHGFLYEQNILDLSVNVSIKLETVHASVLMLVTYKNHNKRSQMYIISF